MLGISHDTTAKHWNAGEESDLAELNEDDIKHLLSIGAIEELGPSKRRAKVTEEATDG